MLKLVVTKVYGRRYTYVVKSLNRCLVYFPDLLELKQLYILLHDIMVHKYLGLSGLFENCVEL